MVSFRLKYIVKDISLDEERSIELQTEAQDDATIELSRIIDSELYKGSKRGDLLCIATLRKKPTRNSRQWFENPTDSLPGGLTEFADGAFHTLAKAVTKTLQLLRWRVGYRDKRNPIKFFHSFEWSVNNVPWTSVPDSIRLELDFGIPYETITEEVVASLHNLWRNNVIEPLAHELFQEAWSQREDNPQSSLVISVAAAETGMKQLISKLVPFSGWLVQNTQSPPLVKMLEEYFPSLPTKLKIADVPPPPLPKSLISIIKKAVLLRNEIVHGKEVHLESKSVREILNVIHDLLYIFDLYTGHLWAMKRISVETKKAWLGVDTSS